jgi:predicted deacylase
MMPAMPHFEVALTPPDLRPWLAGGGVIPGFITRRAKEPGPHVLLLSLMHGNEIAGAIVLDRMLREGFLPARGQVTLGFANLEAFATFDPAQPTQSRFVEEDLNRVWDPAVLCGSASSVEKQRARQMLPAVLAADAVLDLHSMLWPSEPLVLAGLTARGRALARRMGGPGLIVADSGHAAGRRLIDHPRFSGPGDATALLVEAGQHWRDETVAMMERCVAGLLAALGMGPPVAEPPPPRCAEVTEAVVAETAAFSFVRPWRGGEVVAKGRTVLALDGEREVRTPYDDCLLVMPSLRPAPGHTAVRLARFVA